MNANYVEYGPAAALATDDVTADCTHSSEASTRSTGGEQQQLSAIAHVSREFPWIERGRLTSGPPVRAVSIEDLRDVGRSVGARASVRVRESFHLLL
jgi:hypothetical protein